MLKKRKVKISMGKRIAKLIGNGKDFKFYAPTMYVGKHNGYDIIIKYDGASLLYNVYFNVNNINNVDALNKILEKIDKYCVAKNKNNSLIITESCESAKDMAKLANIVLEKTTQYLKKHQCHNLCRGCNKENPTDIVKSDDSITFLCNECYDASLNAYEEQVSKNKKIKENIFMGIIGSIIGSIPGIIIYFILSYLKINSSFAALVIMLGSAYGYKWFAKSMKITGLILSLVIGFISIILANEITNAYILYLQYNKLYKITIFDAYQAIPYYLENSASFKSSYIEDLIIAIIFGLFGSLSNFGLYRKYIAVNRIKKMEVKNEK